MTDITQDIVDAAAAGIKSIYGVEVSTDDLLVTPTKKEHRGDYTLVTFALAKSLRKAPPQIAEALKDYMLSHMPIVSEAEVVQGFLNISLSPDYWFSVLESMDAEPDFWKPSLPREKVLVEFSSPNTNKPLHLGHIRNILLGWSTFKIFEACGHDVTRVQIVNDRGIAICKSMLSWEKYSFGKSPEEVGLKSDHFVGDWYVRFEVEFSKEYAQWQQTRSEERRV